MKRFLLILLLFPLLTFAQSETHDFITYDTTFNSGFGNQNFNIRITRPRHMFDAGNADTAERPAIIMGPGQGEMGTGITDTGKLSVYGPHYWVKQGWDGGIVLGNGKHYPILITIACYNTQYPTRESYYQVLKMLLNTYRIKRNSVHITGLSQSAYSWSDMISYELTTGDEEGMKHVTSLVALSGFQVTTASDSTKYKTWATKYNGQYFGTEGTQDDIRNTWKGAQWVNSVRANTAYFSYNLVAGGGHGNWNDIYNPSATDWRTDPSATKGPYYSASKPLPFGAGGIDNQGNYVYPESVFQWELRQGDTTLVGSGTPAPLPDITAVLTTEYRSAFLTKDSVLKSFNNGSTGLIDFTLPGGRKVVRVAGGFNWYMVIANDGTVWRNMNDGTTTWAQIATDSTGAALTDAKEVDAMADTYIITRSDNSVWLGGNDTLHLFHTVNGVNMRPTQLSPSGMQLKKVLIGGWLRIVGLTTTGDVYEWVLNGSKTPTQKTIPRPAIDIFVDHYDYAGCLIPKADGSQAMGYPYVWGGRSAVWGGSTSFTQPTDITSLWGISGPLKQVCANWNSTHAIDSLGRMWGFAYTNTNGELGNGTEFANKYTYSAPYSWTFIDGENSSSVPMVQIGAGTKWARLVSNTFFTFYKYAQDSSGNWWFWGRDKALVSGRGYLNNDESTYPNALDVTVPTLVTPLTAVRKTYHFQLPNIGAGNNQTITTTSTTLTATGHAAILVNTANSADTLAYTPATWAWTKVSGTGGTIVSPSAKSTSVTGLTNGTYVFQVLMTDNAGGTDTGRVQVIVSAIAPTVNAGNDQVIQLPTTSVTLSGSGSAVSPATSVTYLWTKISGPGAQTITGNTTTAPTVSGLQQGVYVFQLKVTDNNNLFSTDQVQVTVNAAPATGCTNCLTFPRRASFNFK